MIERHYFRDQLITSSKTAIYGSRFTTGTFQGRHLVGSFQGYDFTMPFVIPNTRMLAFASTQSLFFSALAGQEYLGDDLYQTGAQRRVEGAGTAWKQSSVSLFVSVCRKH